METDNKKLLPSLLVALIVALAGGIIWAVVIIFFNFELGIVALGIGALAGYAIGLIAQKNVSTIHQLISVVAALIGIALGKYIAFAHMYTRGDFSLMFDSFTFSVFQKNLSLVFDGFDFFFVILAIMTAWQIPMQFKNAEDNKDAIHAHIEETEEPTNDQQQ